MIADESVEKIIKDEILPLVTSGTILDDSHVARVVERLEAPPIEYVVVRQITGIKMTSSRPLTFGPYTVFSLPEHVDVLERVYPKVRETPLLDCEKGYRIALVVRAGDEVRAQEMANESFARYQHIMSFMIGMRDSRCHVGTTERVFYHVETVLIFSEHQYVNSSQASGPLRDVDVDDPYFTDNENGNKAIWDLVGATNPSDMQKSLLSAIDWVGKGINDDDSARALVQFMFAIESMLKYDEKSVISPSVLHAISEGTAFLVGSTIEERCRIEKQTKDVYSARSAVAHGGKGFCSDEDVELSFAISSSLIRAFLTRRELSALRTKDDLREWIRSKRYSG